jgi:hypothetical protein
MKSSLRLAAAGLAVWMAASAAWAQQEAPSGAKEFAPQAGQAAATEFTPQVGQSGKDVIWVPTPEGTVRGMLQLANVGPRDFVVDLGSGDGRTVITAAKEFGARALGVEFDPRMVELSRKAAAQEGVSERAQFRRADIFATDFSRATVITLYLLPDLNLKLRPRILRMRPGTRVVSHSFDMGDWAPDQTAEAEGRQVLLWIVPARATGKWTLDQPGGRMDLELKQTFQKWQASARSGGNRLEVKEPKLSGDHISFVIEGPDGLRNVYTGRVSGGSMKGTVSAGGKPEGQWSATRQQSKAGPQGKASQPR